MIKLLKVGVVGVGVMGSEHARVYSNLRDCQLVGVFDDNKALAKKVAKRFECTLFQNLGDLLKEVQAISICTPTTTHFSVAKEALNQHVAVLIEKPITSSLVEAERLIDLAKANKTTLAVGHIERFNPVIDVLKRRLEKQKVISINITRMGPIPPRIKDVGIILDLGTHDIDLIRYLTGSHFEKIHSVFSSKANSFEDAAILSFQMKNKTIASILTNWYTPYKVRQIEIATMDKLLIGNLMSQQIVEYSHYEGSGSYVTKILPVKYSEPLMEELNSFSQSVIFGRKPKVTGHDGLEAIRIALLCSEKLTPQKKEQEIFEGQKWRQKFN